MSTLRVTQARVMKSEWTKLRTQPGALWSLLSAVILVVAFGILYSLLRVARPPHGAAAAASFDPTSVSLAGVQLAQVAAGVLGRRDRQVPARHGRPGRDDGAPGSGDVAGPVDRVRRVLCLRAPIAGR